VVRIRFNDPDNLASCESFLQHAFPGEIERSGNLLLLSFRRGSLGSSSERKVVERLLWAWRVSRRIEDDDGALLASEQTYRATD